MFKAKRKDKDKHKIAYNNIQSETVRCNIISEKKTSVCIKLRLLVCVYATLISVYAKAAAQGYVFWKYGLQSSSNLIIEQ